MTNIEKIRAMNDKEITEFLYKIAKNCVTNGDCTECPLENTYDCGCKEGIEGYLKDDVYVEEDSNDLRTNFRFIMDLNIIGLSHFLHLIVKHCEAKATEETGMQSHCEKCILGKSSLCNCKEESSIVEWMKQKAYEDEEFTNYGYIRNMDKAKLAEFIYSISKECKGSCNGCPLEDNCSCWGKDDIRTWLGERDLDEYHNFAKAKCNKKCAECENRWCCYDELNIGVEK